jgi:hypothetical protein
MGTALVWSRAVLLSAVAVLGGVVAHASAHGLLPGPTMMVLLVAAGAVFARPFLLAASSTARVVLLLVAAQTAVHVLLTATSGHAGDPVVSRDPTNLPATVSPEPRVGSLYDQLMRSQPAGAGQDLAMPDWVGHLASDLTGPHALMALLHAAAAAAVGLWLASGERALWGLLALASRSVSRWQTVVIAPAAIRPVPRVVPLDHASLPPPPHIAEPSVPRRGPPLCLAT